MRRREDGKTNFGFRGDDTCCMVDFRLSDGGDRLFVHAAPMPANLLALTLSVHLSVSLTKRHQQHVLAEPTTTIERIRANHLVSPWREIVSLVPSTRKSQRKVFLFVRFSKSNLPRIERRRCCRRAARRDKVKRKFSS